MTEEEKNKILQSGSVIKIKYGEIIKLYDEIDAIEHLAKLTRKIDKSFLQSPDIKKYLHEKYNKLAELLEESRKETLL